MHPLAHLAHPPAQLGVRRHGAAGDRRRGGVARDSLDGISDLDRNSRRELEHRAHLRESEFAGLERAEGRTARPGQAIGFGDQTRRGYLVGAERRGELGDERPGRHVALAGRARLGDPLDHRRELASALDATVLVGMQSADHALERCDRRQLELQRRLGREVEDCRHGSIQAAPSDIERGKETADHR